MKKSVLRAKLLEENKELEKETKDIVEETFKETKDDKKKKKVKDDSTTSDNNKFK